MTEQSEHMNPIENEKDRQASIEEEIAKTKAAIAELEQEDEEDNDVSKLGRCFKVRDAYIKTYKILKVKLTESGSQKQYMLFPHNKVHGWNVFSVPEFSDLICGYLVNQGIIWGNDSVRNFTNETLKLIDGASGWGGTIVDWNSSSYSMPFKNTGKSVSLKKSNVGCVIDTPIEDLMHLPLNCTSEEYEAAENESDWQTMLDVWIPDQDMQKDMQIMYGQALIGNPKSCVPVIHGDGGNGKTTFTNAIDVAFDNYTHSITQPYFINDPKKPSDPHRTFIFDTYKSKFNWITEIDSPNTKFNTGRIKQFSGNETIEANKMHKDPFHFKPAGIFSFVTNFIPELDYDDDAMKRRLRVIHFNHKVVDRLRELDLPNLDGDELNRFYDKVRPQVIRWLLCGLRDYYRNGNKLYISEAIKNESEKYFSDSNVLGDQLEHILYKLPNLEDKGSKVTDVFVRLKEEFPGFYDKMHIKTFNKQLRARGYNLKVHRGSNHIHGFNLTDSGSSSQSTPFESEEDADKKIDNINGVLKSVGWET